MLSVHTSPLDAPGGGDAGGMNVYILETSRRLADAGIAVEVFTRATSSDQPPRVEAHPGVLVRHVAAGPFEGLCKEDLPAQLCAFAAAVLRAEARHEPGWYDVIHSHYWLSGQVGWLARDRWSVPLVHNAHTLGRVKNAALAEDDTPEPFSRIAGEQQVVAEADRLVASTEGEARDLIRWYGADPSRISVVPPGVDLVTFAPAPGARERLRIAPEDLVVTRRVQKGVLPSRGHLLVAEAVALDAGEPTVVLRDADGDVGEDVHARGDVLVVHLEPLDEAGNVSDVLPVRFVCVGVVAAEEMILVPAVHPLAVRDQDAVDLRVRQQLFDRRRTARSSSET